VMTLGLFARQSLAPILERDADELFILTAQGSSSSPTSEACRLRSTSTTTLHPQFPMVNFQRWTRLSCRCMSRD
jgi:hypothetical protein